jgi:hypothetical protein
MRLGIGDELQRVALDPKRPHRLATVTGILTLFPELSRQTFNPVFYPGLAEFSNWPRVGVVNVRIYSFF